MTPREVVRYERTGDAIWSAWDIGLGDLLIIHARSVRLDRGGRSTKAIVTIGLGQGPHSATVLAWDQISVERDRDRTHLANAAGRATDVVEAAVIRELLDLWARGLWRAWLSSIKISDDEGTDDVPPVEWLLRPWIARQAGTILYAPPGSGKSYLAMIMAQSLQYGVSTPVGEVTARARVLYVNLERSAESMRARLGRVNRALGLPVSSRLRFLHARGATLADVADRVADTIADQGVDLVIVDSVSRAGAGSLVEDEVANSIVDTLNSWRVAWLAIAHTAKAEAGSPQRQTVFGSVMQTAAADLVVRITPEEDRPSDSLALSLELVKANDTRRGIARYIVLEMGEHGLERIRAARSDEVTAVAQRTGDWRAIVRETLRYGPRAVGEIIRAAGDDPDDQRTCTRWYKRLSREVAEGRLVSVGTGRYALPAEAPDLTCQLTSPDMSERDLTDRSLSMDVRCQTGQVGGHDEEDLPWE